MVFLCEENNSKQLGGEEGVTPQPAKVLVFQLTSVMDPVFILTSSLDTSLRVSVFISRQNWARVLKRAMFPACSCQLLDFYSLMFLSAGVV